MMTVMVENGFAGENINRKESERDEGDEIEMREDEGEECNAMRVNFNRNAEQEHLISTVMCSGFYPQVVKVSQVFNPQEGGGKEEEGGHRRRMKLTMQNRSRVR